jgi:hypothetical protein
MQLHLRSALTLTLLCTLFSCDFDASTPTPDRAATNPQGAAGGIEPTAGIQDIMTAMIDPAADFLWASVSFVQGPNGFEERKPETDAEWAEVRRQAIILTEAANLIQVQGRHVVKEGEQLEDAGTPGNLTASESELAIRSHWDSFQVFSDALHDAGSDMLSAIDARNTQGMLDAGDRIDEACESCHLQFWYPGQYIPPILEQDLEKSRQRSRPGAGAD